MAIPPFVNINGQPYLVVNYDLGGEVIELRTTLDALLEHHATADILLLRPLSKTEGLLLCRTSRDADVEAWAQMMVKEQDRFRPRK